MHLIGPAARFHSIKTTVQTLLTPIDHGRLLSVTWHSFVPAMSRISMRVFSDS